MASEFHKKAISRITEEERTLMVKSMEIISQIYTILDSKNINQKELSEMLKVSPAAVSKMLSVGGNLELNTINKLEILLGETIITTPQSIIEMQSEGNTDEWRFSQAPKTQQDHLNTLYTAFQPTYGQIPVN
ncbi:MAG: hypothetical protein ACOYMA_07470 [Bacteroidia bacterium]